MAVPLPSTVLAPASSVDADQEEGRSFLFPPTLIRPFSLLDKARALCSVILYALLPQLLRSWIRHEKPRNKKLFATSYINGLRGICAVRVFTFHFMYAHTRATSRPWNPDNRFNHIIEMPIIRWCFAGSTSHIFFAVGGYLMTLRLVQLMGKGDQSSHAKLFANISTSLFRRIFRLYLPMAAMTLLTSTLVYLGCFEPTRTFTMSPHRRAFFAGGAAERIIPQAPTLMAQMKIWAREYYLLTNIWTERPCYSPLDPHLWSLAYELRASLHVYLVLLITGMCRKEVRLFLILLSAVLYFYWNRWEMWVFLLGSAVAQVDVLMPPVERAQDLLMSAEERIHEKPSKLPVSTHHHHHNGALPFWSRSLRNRHGVLGLLSRPAVIRPILFLAAFYMLSYPLCCQEGAYGWGYLNRFIPSWMDRKDKFYSNFGAILLIFLLCRADPTTSKWHQILNSSIPQYLGTISFGIYLCHGPLCNIMIYLFPNFVWMVLGYPLGAIPQDMTVWTLGIVVGWALGLVVLLWAADVWVREVEGRCVRAVKKLEEWCFQKSS